MYRDDNHFVEAIKVRSRVSSLEHEIFLDESISGKVDGTKNSIGFVLTNTLLQKMNEWALNQEVEGGSNAKEQ